MTERLPKLGDRIIDWNSERGAVSRVWVSIDGESIIFDLNYDDQDPQTNYFWVHGKSGGSFLFEDEYEEPEGIADDWEYLKGLAERLMRVPARYGTDQGDVDRLIAIANHQSG